MTQCHEISRAKTSSRSSESVLVVDDEPLVRWSVKNCLVKAGFRVTTAESGEVAVDFLKSGDFRIVITDMRLPQMDGFEVARAAKKTLGFVGVVMITAFADDVPLSQLHNAGINCLVAKPFGLIELAELVKRLTSHTG